MNVGCFLPVEVRRFIRALNWILCAYIGSGVSESARKRQTQESGAELRVSAGLDVTSDSANGSWKSAHRGRSSEEAEEGI